MSFRLVYEFVSGELYSNMRREVDAFARAATATMGEVGKLAQTGARQAMAGAGFSVRFQNAVRFNVYPSGRDSLRPAAVVKSKIDFAGVFETGATIAGRLWVPLPTVPMIGGRRMRIGEYLERVGPLINMKGTSRPMLGAYVRATDARIAKGISRTLLKRGRNDGGRGELRLIPLFVGVASVTDPKKYDAIAAMNAAGEQIGEIYQKNLGQD